MEVEKKCCDYSIKEKSNDITANDHTPADLIKIVHNVAKKEGFNKYKIHIKPITADGGNYLAVLYEVDIKGIKGNSEKEVNIFVKYTIDGENQKIISLKDAYTKESFSYNELSKMFTDLQDQVKIPLKERLNMVKCYDANTEVILMENMAKKGFKTYHRMETMPLRFAELAIEQLARFHGLFYVIKNKTPSFFEKYLSSYEQHFILNDQCHEFFMNNSKATIQSLDENLKQKCLKFIPNITETYRKFTGEKGKKYSTICHGDYRINNILVKENNGVASEVVPVDHQLLYHGCPMNDFIYFIFTGTDKEFRKKHMDYLKDLYHGSLTKFLNYFNLDVNEIYPRDEFDRQFKERLELGLVQTLYCTPFIFVDEKKAADVVNEDFTNIDFVIDPRGHDRVKGAIEDFIEWGVL